MPMRNPTAGKIRMVTTKNIVGTDKSVKMTESVEYRIADLQSAERDVHHKSCGLNRQLRFESSIEISWKRLAVCNFMRRDDFYTRIKTVTNPLPQTIFHYSPPKSCDFLRVGIFPLKGRGSEHSF